MAAIDSLRTNGDPTVPTLVTYALWFFLGTFGAHRFVTGRVASGVAMLALFMLGWATVWLLGLGLIFLVPAAIWWLVDALLIPGWIRR
jgi:TM2 domain-containing membrane protein YozV